MRTSYDSTMVHIAGRTPQEVTDAIAEATKEAWERLCKKLETDSPVVQGFTVVPLSWEFLDESGRTPRVRKVEAVHILAVMSNPAKAAWPAREED